MKTLVDGLADLSALRDREAMEFALVQVVRQVDQSAIRTVRLLRLVGEPGDQRWLVRAVQQFDQQIPKRDQAWADLSALPRAEEFPMRLQAVQRGYLVESRQAPCVSVFSVGSAPAVACVLEIESDQPLNEASAELVHGILRAFFNLQDLLDYGERDALTELLNRKSFDGAFFKSATAHNAMNPVDGVERRAVQAGGYWLAVLDIDHFKRVNDNFGHLIGDEVLLLMARLMRASFRFHDQLYRFGGEEFVVLMRCSLPADAAGALERFRRATQTFEFPQVGTITVSIGYTTLRNDDTPGSAFDRADKAVYYAKEHGRNQVCSYQELVEKGELQEAADDSQEIDFF
jgi:diguanylate cyclase (GGDEF)-like protein